MLGKGKNVDGGLSLSKADDRIDDLGPYPSDVEDSPSNKRVVDRALRNISIAMLVSGMVNIALIMLIITLFPLQKVYPYLVTFKNQDNQVVSIEPIAMDAPGVLYATEDNVRDYVTQRHSFIPIQATMDARWGADSRLAARTEPELYKKFAEASKTEMKDMMTQGYSRQVSINSVTRISPDTWQVSFTTTDSLGGMGGTLTGDPKFGQDASTVGVPGNPTAVSIAQTETKQQWVASLRVNYEPQKVTYDKRLVNPLGFTVTDYSVTRRTS